MKNILIVSPALLKGGMERQLSLFFENYERKDFNITLAVFKNKIEYNIPNDITLLPLNKRYKLDIVFYIKLIRLINNKNFNLINSKISGINEILMILCGLFIKRNLIVEIRSSGIRMRPYYKKMSLIYKAFKIKWPIICNSNKAYKELQNYIPKDIPIHILKNGINVNYFSPKKAIKNKMFTLGFVGSFKPVKNIELLIKAVYELKKKGFQDIQLQIIGNAQNKTYYKKLINLQDELDLKSNIKWVGSTEDVVTYYNSFDIFILSSYEEGTPNVLLEAMSCRCFCLISNQANSDNYLPNEFTFDAYNLNSLVNKIVWFTTLSNNNINIIKATSRNFVIEHHSIENMVNSYSEILASIQ